jgi:hypothetical protein
MVLRTATKTGNVPRPRTLVTVGACIEPTSLAHIASTRVQPKSGVAIYAGALARRLLRTQLVIEIALPIIQRVMNPTIVHLKPGEFAIRRMADPNFSANRPIMVKRKARASQTIQRRRILG